MKNSNVFSPKSLPKAALRGAARVLDLAPAVVNRTTRKLALTDVGQEYLECAKRILA